MKHLFAIGASSAMAIVIVAGMTLLLGGIGLLIAFPVAVVVFVTMGEAIASR